MNNKSIDERIAEMIESARKKPGIGLELSRDYSFSLLNPSGDYFKQKRIELAKQIEHESMFGWAWARYKCSPDILETDWIYKCTKIELNSMEEKAVWNQLELFLDQFLLWLQYENIVRENESVRELIPQQKEYVSLRRVYSFILAESYHKGNTVIKSMSKPDFKNYVSEKFKDTKKANIVYQTVRSSYKLEFNFLNFYTEMKKEHSKDYDYAMKIYKNYFPENLESESK